MFNLSAGKLCIEVTPASKIAFISEELCIGCGICVKVCACFAVCMCMNQLLWNSCDVHMSNYNGLICQIVLAMIH